MPALKELITGYHRFRTGRWANSQDRYRELDAGQDPDIMVIGCADSRVEPAVIFDTVPGQAFVVRNVANLVPPYEKTGARHGVSAALEFAVNALKVKYILIVGHGHCGGISACLSAWDTTPEGEFIAPWVEIAAEARYRVVSGNPGASREVLQRKLEQEAITTSLANLMTFPFVRKAVDDGKLSLQGSWFDIGAGELHMRDPVSGVFDAVGFP